MIQPQQATGSLSLSLDHHLFKSYQYLTLRAVKTAYFEVPDNIVFSLVYVKFNEATPPFKNGLAHNYLAETAQLLVQYRTAAIDRL